MISCESCGTPWAGRGRFCGTCGAPLPAGGGSVPTDVTPIPSRVLPGPEPAFESEPAFEPGYGPRSGYAPAPGSAEAPGPPSGWLPPATATEVAAGFGRRLGALVSDLSILSILVGVLAIPAILIGADDSRQASWRNLDTSQFLIAGVVAATVTAFVLLTVLGEGGPSGATLGKRMFGIRVIPASGSGPVGYARAAGRFLAHGLDVVLYASSLSMLVDRHGRTLHDKISGTAVIRDSRGAGRGAWRSAAAALTFALLIGSAGPAAVALDSRPVLVGASDPFSAPTVEPSPEPSPEPSVSIEPFIDTFATEPPGPAIALPRPEPTLLDTTEDETAAEPSPPDGDPSNPIAREPDPDVPADECVPFTGSPTNQTLLTTRLRDQCREDVRMVQRWLIALGLLPEGLDDGKYGESTRAAVTLFQTSRCLGVDPDIGVGPKTWRALRDMLPSLPSCSS